MGFLNYIIWNVSPELFTIGSVTPRWYGLLFASGFLFGQWIIANIFKLEGKPEKDLERLMIYMVLATIVGARLGHCLFYQPDYFLANPIEILYVWEGGLASHGAAIGILLALYFYSRNRKGQSFLWVVDRIVIVAALGGALIRLGNLMNSEIIGKPADTPFSFVFAHSLDEALNIGKSDFIASQKLTKLEGNKSEAGIDYKLMRLDINFKKETVSEAEASLFIQNTLLPILKNTQNEVSKHFKIFEKSPKVNTHQEGKFVVASLDIYAIPRHAAQLYEAISCFLLFWFLLWLYYRQKEKTPEGQLFAIFMIVVFTLRFFYEFLKENQVPFEEGLSLNMGQILSIPAVLGALLILYFASKKKNQVEKNS